MARRASETTKLIALNALKNGHALSYSDQPYFKELMDLMRSDQPVTLIVGAGVSMDSGLPSWPALLDVMADKIEDPIVSKVAKIDGSDQLRRAEFVQSMRQSFSSDSPISVVRSALYQDQPSPRPGELAEAIARLVGLNPSRFRVLTTNFDNMLELAFRERFQDTEVRSVGLYDSKPEDTNGFFNVLHLHGMITPNNLPAAIEPVVLTESEFLRHGTAVQKAVREAMSASAMVIFVGVSLTDPNLVGPLWDISHPSPDYAGQAIPEVVSEASIASRIPKYVFGVVTDPTPGSHISFEDAANIMRLRSEYNERLGARPILLKSFSQLIQAFNEMGLCAAQPERYVVRPKSGQSTRYGVRFERALSSAYGAIGARRSTESPKDLHSRTTLSDRLERVLYGRRGIVSLIETEMQKQMGVESIGDERFALFLWLRRRATGKVSAPYGITLVGTSAFVHRSDWSFDRPDEISFNSRWLASRSLFLGGMQFANGALAKPHIPTEAGSKQVWNGVLARPLILNGFGSGGSGNGELDGLYDRMTIGAITLNSTYTMVDGDDAPKGVPRSALASLTDTESLNEISERLNSDVLRNVLFPEA